ncbi:hypothetical protein D3C78_1994650 [compost metagenome]
MQVLGAVVQGLPKAFRMLHRHTERPQNDQGIHRALYHAQAEVGAAELDRSAL